MKITFFLIAFCLVFIRLYMGWTGHWRNDGNDGTMTYSNGDDDIQLKWSGKARLNEDETAVERITPGGYLKFRHNDEKMSAESNLQGDITYELFDGQHQLTMDGKGKKFLAGIIHEMIEFGYDAEGRIERIYKKGGKKALLDEEEKLRSDYLRGLYIDRLLKTDSLTKADMVILTQRIGELGSDFEKGQRLSRFTPDQLKDSGTVQSWLAIVGHMGGDHDKSELLGHLIDQDSISREVADKILDIAGHFGGDWEKQHLLSKLMDKDSLPSDHFNRLLEAVSHFGGDVEKENFYTLLMEKKRLTEEQWSGLIKATETLRSDFEKAGLLVKIAKKMPANNDLKVVYMQAAKTINADPEYGKAVRAVE